MKMSIFIVFRQKLFLLSSDASKLSFRLKPFLCKYFMIDIPQLPEIYRKY